MGLSASQARLLTLTARQSNLEYEGQQINQQRTTLSNASSNYYNSLLEMKVPVPPSTNDYTKIVYNFIIGGNEATVKEALPKVDKDGNTKYYVSYTTELSTIGVQENESYKTAASATKSIGAVSFAGENEPWVDEFGNGENQGYFLATMNSVNLNEPTQLGDGIDLYVKDPSWTEGCTIIGPDGYQITKDAYDSIAGKASKPIYVVKENKVGYMEKNSTTGVEEFVENTDPTVTMDNYKEFNRITKEASEQLGKVRFFRKFDNDNPLEGDLAAQKYAISYAKIPNEAAYYSHQKDGDIDKDVIYKIKEGAESGPVGFYTYKSSVGSAFTVVDIEYAESFLNAGLNIDDYYQYAITSGEKTTYRFVKRQDVEGNLNTSARSINTSSVTTIKVTKENTISNATLEFDHAGRISTITDEEGHTFTLTATTTTDQAAYNDAYNQYEYDQYVYDQKQSEINAKIKILQAQDKSLELRLSNLDTQHSAIQTELEAVKKVMSKNIENSFKTFNA